LTGLREARTEIVCSIDCDCSYDPLELKHMIPLLAGDVDLVTASPYHPAGGVRNVPGWRLSLSSGASWLYRRVLRSPLHTFTSCFRVYRRSSVLDLPITQRGFLGMAEILGQLLLRNGRVVEHPAVLNVRLFGASKMKTLRTIAGHLRLMSQLSRQRMFGPRVPSVAQLPNVSASASPGDGLSDPSQPVVV
jgi:dolichol-phosphate mannosyltransferase